MTTTQAEELVRRALAQVAPDADLSSCRPDEPFREVLDLDSLDFLSLVEQLGDLSGVTVPETDYAQVQTLAGLYAYLEQHGAALTPG